MNRISEAALRDWAADSGYTLQSDGWYDDQGQGPYDLREQHSHAMEAAEPVLGSGRFGIGALLIAIERQRQVDSEGWTPEHDDEHIHGELAAAAVSYIVISDPDGAGDTGFAEDVFPWERSWWKPSDDPIRNLVKAGALIAAEIDRRQRARG